MNLIDRPPLWLNLPERLLIVGNRIKTIADPIGSVKLAVDLGRCNRLLIYVDSHIQPQTLLNPHNQPPMLLNLSNLQPPRIGPSGFRLGRIGGLNFRSNRICRRPESIRRSNALRLSISANGATICLHMRTIALGIFACMHMFA